jgi:hypothetical protein
MPLGYGVRNTGLFFFFFHNFIIFLSFFPLAPLQLTHTVGLSSAKNPFLRSSDPRKDPLNRVKPLSDVFICNADVVMRRSAGTSAAADRC